MSKHIVVSVKRDRWFWPKLTITVEARVTSESAGQKFITKQVMDAYAKRGGKVYVRIKVKDYRVVDEAGLRRLRAAAKASVTIRRRRAAKKAAVTRAKRKASQTTMVSRMRSQGYMPGNAFGVN